jgi:hypothetical protein
MRCGFVSIQPEHKMNKSETEKVDNIQDQEKYICQNFTCVKLIICYECVLEQLSLHLFQVLELLWHCIYWKN